ncbi:MAG TPA: sugar ABC transporter ATP-binding protein [Roseiarcus sp.]|nr:sugar ABC transporter ATP-binding protein [Roseiarcus sp.]
MNADAQTNYVLEATDIEKSFGATDVLRKANLRVAHGEIHALLGGNGAGKSTLIRIVSGSLRRDAGAIEVAGRPDYDPSAIAVVFQELALLPDLNVAENIHLPHRRDALGRIDRRQMRDLAAQALAMIDPALTVTLDKPVSRLDLHQRQLVEIARAISSGAKLILLDEPTANLTFADAERLFAALRRLTIVGISILIVSHRMSEIRAVADVCTILRDGQSVIDRRPLLEIADEEIVQAMMGDGRGPAAAHAAAAHPAMVAGVTLGLAKDQLALTLSPGSVLGLAGAPEGPAGVIGALTGSSTNTDWSVTVNGQVRRFRSPADAVRSGVGYVSGDRAEKGVLATLPIVDNLAAAGRIARKRWLVAPSEVQEAAAALQRLAIKAASLYALPQTLSGGTQQKLLIARWLNLAPKILVLEEPTRGVDVGAKREIYQIIRTVAAAGSIIVWWSTEFSELAQTCDHVITFDLQGAISGLLRQGEITEVAMARATGMAA